MIPRQTLGCVVVLALSSLGAADPPPKGYVCGRVKTPVVIDGRIDEDVWKSAPWTEDFVDIEGDAKPRPRFRTRVKMVWDDQYLYIAAELEEPHVWGKLTRHDSVIFQDNDFEVFIDPDGDNHEYYEIEVNALNTEWDLFLGKPYRDGGPAVDAWEIPGLKTATNVQGTLNDPTNLDHAWTVELALPWKVLGEYAHRTSPPIDGDQWRINFSRVEWEHRVEGKNYQKVEGKREDNWVWSPQIAVDMHRPERWGFLQFSANGPGQASYRVDPSMPARDQLILIYRAERAYQDKNKKWSASLEELGLATLVPPGKPAIKLGLTDQGFEASTVVEAEAGFPRRILTIRQDSRINQVEAKP